jgi:hypothetical protein
MMAGATQWLTLVHRCAFTKSPEHDPPGSCCPVLLNARESPHLLVIPVGSFGAQQLLGVPFLQVEIHAL